MIGEFLVPVFLQRQMVETLVHGTATPVDFVLVNDAPLSHSLANLLAVGLRNLFFSAHLDAE